MAQFETKTTWEGFSPSENCHESGGAPTIYLSRHVLGVQIDGPAANRRLAIEPHLGDLKRAEGVVVTECGPVPVAWNRPDGTGELTFEIEIPAGAAARVSVPRPPKGEPLTVDDRAVHPSGDSSRRFVTIEIGEGRHRVVTKESG
jgi:hypothetical protein